MPLVKPIPDGYHSVTPYLMVKDATRALDFYRQVFGAVETVRMAMPDGKIGHAEIKIGDSVIMLADEFPAMGMQSPQTIGATPVALLLYVEDVDGVARRAVAAGAREIRPIQNQFYGDRSGVFSDPFGHTWNLATHVEDVSPEEMRRRAEAACAESKK